MHTGGQSATAAGQAPPCRCGGGRPRRDEQGRWRPLGRHGRPRSSCRQMTALEVLLPTACGLTSHRTFQLKTPTSSRRAATGRPVSDREVTSWSARTSLSAIDLGAGRPWRCKKRACQDRKEPGEAPAPSKVARTAAQAADRRVGAARSRAAPVKSSASLMSHGGLHGPQGVCEGECPRPTGQRQPPPRAESQQSRFPRSVRPARSSATRQAGLRWRRTPHA
eukprot:15444063-Alexandrium_andersonii.AAC.1